MVDDNIKFLQADEVHLFYEMMYQSLKTDDVIEGMGKSLYLLKATLGSGNVILHRKNKDNIYDVCISDNTIKEVPNTTISIVNKAANLIKNKETLDIDLGLTEELMNMKLIYLKTDNHEYILSINNYSNNSFNETFINRLIKTLEIILKRAETYEKNVKAINIDLLTELNNRNSYETTIQNLDEKSDGLVYGLFDLFRLKYVNDNYSHELGDVYIQETAKILSKYWPKDQNDNTTGHCVYRIGGDEFVLLTTNESIELAKIKAALAAEEVRMINLGVAEELPLGLNYGIVEHIAGDKIKNTYVNADIIMASDKEKMYTKFNIERRK